MAEEINLKVNVEGGQGKKTVADVRKELDEADKSAKKLGTDLGSGIAQAAKPAIDVRQKLRELQNQMAEIGDVGSAEFQKLAAEAGKYKDQMNNANAAIKSMSADFPKLQVGVQALQALGGAAQAAMSVQALLGTENEAVTKSIQKMVAIQGIMNAITQTSNLLGDESAIGLKIRTIQQTLFNKAKVAEAVATGKATVAQKIFNTVLNANPIGLIITGIAALIGLFVLLGTRVKAVGDFFVYLKDKIVEVISAYLMFYGITDKAIETTSMKERKLAEQRGKESRQVEEQHQKRLAEITKERDARIEASNKTIKALELQKDTLEANGKSSSALTRQILEEELEKTKAIFEANEAQINSAIKKYTDLAALRGQDEESFKASMRAQGIDLDMLQEKANAILQENADTVQFAENKITKFKREQNEARSNDAKANADELAKIEQARLDEIQKQLESDRKLAEKKADDLFKRKVDARDKLHELEVQSSGDAIAILELEHQKKIEKLDENIPAEHELILFYEQELRDKKLEQQEAWADEDAQALEAERELRQADRDNAIDSAQKTATELLSIAESFNTIAHGKELKRIHAKQAAGESLTKNEIKRLKQEDRIRKAQALAQVGFDTAKGISGAIAAGAGVPFPGNIVAIISGVAAVLSGVAQASKILGQTLDVGGAEEITSAATQQTEVGNQTPRVNEITSGSTLLNQEPLQIYVVESDITETQDSVNAIVQQATF